MNIVSLPSPSSHQFAQVPEAEIQRSQFDRTFGHKTTFDAGYLIPIFVDEVLPGDTFNLQMTMFARMQTTIVPIMDNLFLDSFFFFVPNRLIWSHWEKFNGAQDNPGDSTSFTVPQVVAPNVAGGGVVSSTLFDYMGIPVGPLNGGGGSTGIAFNNLHGRAYNLIWNTWFRDQNLQNSLNVPLGDGPDTYTDFVLQRRGKRHDYFTSCLPWPQKGTAVSIPLGTSAPVILDPTKTGFSPLVKDSPTFNLLAGPLIGTAGTGVFASTTGPTAAVLDPNSTLLADLTNATAATINSLRQAFQLQKLYERDARGGTRYTEILRAHFGVISPDARLQRPEYLGGGSSPVIVNPVAQTSGTGATGTTTPMANLSSFVTVHGSNHGFSKSFVEHGVLIGLVSVRADLTYQQGLNRMFSRRTRFDFYWPALAHIGEQSVLNQEIYANVPDGTSSVQKQGIFGYQERFAEYRYKPSMITGVFRSNVSAGVTPLDVWHLSQNFGSLPTLADTFIKETPPISRVVAVPSQPQFFFDSYTRLICARPMPVYGVPGLIDHF